MASATVTVPKRDDIIRFRAEPDLKRRLVKVAKSKRKKYSEYLRDKLWEVVEAEEAVK